MAAGSWQLTASRTQRSGVKLISDLRLLTSVIDDFYAFYDFYGFNDLLFTARSALSLSKGSLLTKGYAPIMKILAIDTSTPVGSIAIVEGALLKAQHILNISATHNQRLLPGIDRILTDADWTLDDLDGLAVSLGPGSFTGLRIGLSVVKGLAWATGKPLAGVPTLDALAANVPLAPYPIYPVLDARKGEIYTALYRMDDEQVPARLSPYMAIKPEKLVDLISEKTLLVGDALLRYGDYWRGKLGERLHLVPPHLNVVHASSVAWLAWHKLRRGIHEDISSCTPLYVRPSEAELNRISE